MIPDGSMIGDKFPPWKHFDNDNEQTFDGIISNLPS